MQSFVAAALRFDRVRSIANHMMHRFFTSGVNWMSLMCLGNVNRSTPTEPFMPKRLTARPTTSRVIPSERDAIITTIALTHLDLETLESRNMDSLDFKEQSCLAIRAALLAAFEAGKQAARRRVGSPPVAPPTVIKGDIMIAANPKAERMGWTTGRIGTFRFCAKVYPEHALEASYEIGRSRISKLELRRLDTGAVAFAWDRGLDTPATDAAAQQAVDRLGKYLANHLYGHTAI